MFSPVLMDITNQKRIMSRFDIISCKLILVIAGMLIVVAELCLLLHELYTGASGSNVAWARCLFLVAGLLILVFALRVRRR